MKKYFRQISVAICLLTLILPVLAKQPRTAAVTDGDRKKANYIFLEAIAKNAENDAASAYDLLRTAHETDPENPVIAYYYGFSKMSLDDVTETEVESGLRLMRRMTVERPEDYYENYIYALLCSSLGDYDESIRVVETLLAKYPEKTQMYPVLAKSYASKGDFAKAIAVTDSLEKTEGRSMQTTIDKIGYMLGRNDTAAIINEGKAYLRTAPNSVEPNTLMGNIYAQLGDPDSAFVYYDRALAIDPESGFVNLQKANLYYSLGDSVGYERETTTVLLNKNIEIDTKVEILTDYIRTHVLRNDSSARVDNMFRTILEQHPHEAQIHSLYSDYLTFRKDYKDAAEQLSYTLDIDPSDPKNWKRMMWLYLYVKQPEKAIEAGRKALEMHPDELEFYQILGSAYYQLSDYDKSIENYETLLAKNDSLQMVDEAEVYSAMAESYYEKGDMEKTFACYETSLRHDPENPLSLNNYAYFLCINEPDSIDKAERMSAMAVKEEPENASYLDTYAWIKFLRRDYKAALEYIEKAAEFCDKTENNSELWEHYGDILFMLGRPDEALEKWKDAEKGNPGSKLLKKKIDNKTYFYE